MTIEFAVRADAVRLCLPHISKEVTSYYLNGIHFEPGPDGKGVIAVATDGHKLGVAYDEQGVFARGKSAIVRDAGLCVPALTGKRGDNETALFGKKKPPKILRWLVVRDQVAIVVLAESAEKALELEPLTEQTMAVACRVLLDGTFPDWRRVMPKSLSKMSRKDLASLTADPPSFNGIYLKAFADNYAKVAKTKNPQMRLIPTALDGPALVQLSDRPDLPDFFGVLMPMQWSGEPAELPIWAAKPETKAAA